MNVERKDCSDRGATVVWVALMMFALLGIAAVAVDLGMAWASKRQLSSTADAVALAGAQQAAMDFTTGDCAGGVPSSALIASVNGAVATTHTANSPRGSTGVPAATVTCTDSEVTVAVTERSSLSTLFGRIFGVATLDPAASATARVFGAKNLGGLRPFLVCLDDALHGRANPTVTHQSYYAKPDSNTTPSGLTLIEGDLAWAAGSSEITTASNHGLSTGDYIYLEVSDAGVNSGYYYAIRTGNRSFQATATRGGSPVGASTTGTVDVYRMPPPAGGGTATWATNGIVTRSGHGLADGAYVRVSVVANLVGATDGFYFVSDVTATTFRLQRIDGTSPTITTQGTINVYELPPPGAPASGCMPASSPANWGYSAFDYSNSDNPQIECLIEFGYGGGNRCPDADPPGVNLGSESNAIPAEGDNGNNLQTSAGPLIDALVGEVILLPVGSGWNGLGGNNAQYDGNGAIAVTFCGAWIPKNNNDGTYANAKWRSSKAPCWDQGLADSPRDLVTNTPITIEDTSLVIQWRYADDWVTSYIGQNSSSSDVCPLGSATCVPALQLIQ